MTRSEALSRTVHRTVHRVLGVRIDDSGHVLALAGTADGPFRPRAAGSMLEPAGRRDKHYFRRERHEPKEGRPT